MIVPPIIERELRVASRRGMTYWMRLAAGLGILAVAAPLLAIFEIGPRMTGGAGGIPANQLGPILFGAFSFVAIVTAVVAGWYFASDALSFETREGTLELLFLAPVRASDVVLSKLATLCWRAGQWLLAVFPIFALPILTGSVTGQDFLILACVATNTLFWSIATSLHASARAKSPFEAISGTIALQFAFFTIPFAVDLVVRLFDQGEFTTRAGLVNPIYGWTSLSGRRSALFWAHLGLLQAVSWLIVAHTIRLVSARIRQDPSIRPPGPAERASKRWKYGSPAFRTMQRGRLLARNPVSWLVERERGPQRFMNVVFAVILVGLPTAWLATGESSAVMAIGTATAFLFSLVVAVIFATQATRFLVEARRTGALELLLVTPQSSRDVLRGQFASLGRTFWLPVTVLALGSVGLGLWQFASMRGAMPATGAVAGGAMGAGFLDLFRYQWITVALGTGVMILSYFSLAWVGAWMGLVCRQASLALLASLVLAKILPAFGGSFLQGVFMPLILSNRVPGWVVIVVQHAGLVAFHLSLIWFARCQLLPDLRRVVEAPTRFVLGTKRADVPPVLATAP